MQKFEFSLERVLSLRQKQERQADLEQVRARGEVLAAESRVKEAEDELRQYSRTLAGTVGQTLPPHQIAAGYERSRYLTDALAARLDDVLQKQDAFQAACAARAQIAQEVEALKTLKAEQLEEYRQELLKFEQEQVDNTVMRNWAAAALESE